MANQYLSQLLNQAVEIKGSVAVVTGGGRGIGLAIARSLALAGSKVVVCDAGYTIDGKPGDPDVASRAVESLKASHLEAVASSVDVSTWDGANKLLKETLDSFGPPSILVNNAAIIQDKMVFNMEEKSFEQVLRNNLFSAFYLSSLVSKGMKERLSGRIVNIVSSSGLIGNRGQSNYGTAKGGLVSLSRINALELARYGVTVNAIAPFAHTRVTETIVPTTPWLKEYLETVKDRASPERVGELVRYLCTDKAKVVTGQVFGVRGDEVFLFSQPRPVGVEHAGEGKDLTEEFLDKAFAHWEEKGLFTPLETDLMHFSRKLK